MEAIERSARISLLIAAFDGRTIGRRSKEKAARTVFAFWRPRYKFCFCFVIYKAVLCADFLLAHPVVRHKRESVIVSQQRPFFRGFIIQSAARDLDFLC